MIIDFVLAGIWSVENVVPSALKKIELGIFGVCGCPKAVNENSTKSTGSIKCFIGYEYRDILFSLCHCNSILYISSLLIFTDVLHSCKKAVFLHKKITIWELHWI